MQVPVISGRQAFAKGAVSPNVAKQFRRTQSTDINIEDDATVLALRGDSSSKTDTLAGKSITYDGELPSLLKNLREVAQRITILSASDDSLSSEQNAAREKEVLSLKQQFNEIRSSDRFKQLLEVTDNVNSRLQSGASPTALASGLSSQAGLLGSDFIHLAQSGSSSQISTVSSLLKSLKDVDLNGDLSSFLKDVRDAENSLLGSSVQSEQNAIVPTAEESEEIVPLEQTESTFSTGGGMAISLHTYSARDMIRAAASGAFKDASAISQISIEKPASEDERAHEEKKSNQPKNSGGRLDILA